MLIITFQTDSPTLDYSCHLAQPTDSLIIVMPINWSKSWTGLNFDASKTRAKLDLYVAQRLLAESDFDLIKEIKN